MNFPQIRKLIIKALREAENEALDEGVDVTTDEFRDVLKQIRDAILKRLNVPVADYLSYLDDLKEIGRAKSQAKKDELEARLEEMQTQIETRVEEMIPEPATFEGLPDKPTVLSKEEITSLIDKAIKKFPRAKPIVNIFRPITKETVIETVQYDDKPLKKTLEEVKKQVSEIKPPELDHESLRQFFRDEFSENFKKNTDLLGMPDFRRLAMGLREDIDKLQKEIAAVEASDVDSITNTDGYLNISPNTGAVVVNANGSLARNNGNYVYDVAGNALNAVFADSSNTVNSLSGHDNTELSNGAGYITTVSGGDHNSLSNLTVGDVHTQYAFLAGRSGGQLLIGGTASGNSLTLRSTSNATKGKILFGTSAYDEVNNRLGIGTTTPTVGFEALNNGLISDAGNSNQKSGTFIVYPQNRSLGVSIGYQGISAITPSGSGNIQFYLESQGTEAVYVNSRGGGLVVNGTTNDSNAQTLLLYTLNNINVRMRNTNVPTFRSDIFLNNNGDAGWYNYDDGTGAFKGFSFFGDPISFNANGAGTSAGFFGIGVYPPQARFHVVATTEQARLGYDGSNYFSTTIGSTGGVTFDAIGSGAAFSFLDKVSVSNPINLKNYTVATLPTGVRGDVAYVTDALAPAFLTAAVGGGAIVTPVFYNGANWVAY